MKKRICLILVLLISMSIVFAQTAVFAETAEQELLFSLPIGYGEGKIAYTEDAEDAETFGPESFAILNNGTIYILDSVENQVEVFDNKGNPVLTVNLPSEAAYTDIEVESNGAFYVLTDNGKILLYEKNNLKKIEDFSCKEKINNLSLKLAKDQQNDVVIIDPRGGNEIKITSKQAAKKLHGTDIKKQGKRMILSYMDNSINIDYKYTPAGTYPLKNTPKGEFLVIENEALVGQSLYVETRISKYEKGKWTGTAIALPTNQYYTKVPHKYIYATDNGQVIQMYTNNNSLDLFEISYTKGQKTKIDDNLASKVLGNTQYTDTNLYSASIVSSTAVSPTDAYWRALDMTEVSWYYTPSTMKTPSTSTTTPPDHLTGSSNSNEIGIPYKWGGMNGIDTGSLGTGETYTNYTTALTAGKKAGDINTSAVSSICAGIDCSGYICAAYKIYPKLGTSTMSNQFSNCSWSNLVLGDIMNKPNDHVVMYYGEVYDWYDNLIGYDTYESTVAGYGDKAKEYSRNIQDLQNYQPMKKN